MKMNRTHNQILTGTDNRKLEQERFAGFVADLRRRGRADKTIGSYRSDWIGFNQWHASAGRGDFSILTVEPEAVLAYVKHLRSEDMKPRATINRKIVFIKRYIGWANGIGLVSDDRTEALTKIKLSLRDHDVQRRCRTSS